MIVHIFHVVAGVIAAASAAPQLKYYASRYDHLDVEAILNNRRMVNYYAACLLSKGPCPPQGLEFKQILPEALQTSCARCTEKQKTVTYRTIKRLKKEYPKIWEQLAALWDPDNIYVRKFEMNFENYKPSIKPTIPTTTSTTSTTTTTAAPAVLIGDRFGADEENNNNNNNKPYPAPDYSTSTSSSTTAASTSTTTTTTISTTTTTLDSSTSSSTTTTTTTTTKPTNTYRPLLTTRKPTFGTVGTNLQTTVSFVAAIKNIAIQLYQHKLETLRRILSGR